MTLKALDLKDILEFVYHEGFMSSGEGYNGEFPFSQKSISPEDDEPWCKNREKTVTTMLALWRLKEE